MAPQVDGAQQGAGLAVAEQDPGRSQHGGPFGGQVGSGGARTAPSWDRQALTRTPGLSSPTTSHPPRRPHPRPGPGRRTAPRRAPGAAAVGAVLRRFALPEWRMLAFDVKRNLIRLRTGGYQGAYSASAGSWV
ncbi:hypothetical protein CHO01_04730 [Cellulomonas hominis]|uniref:Uncharacterized protein n=1 Tax=Cellulomonas hominis TaxID=156981 RepID=A0A511FAQ4_9CELL|nr:hypothetical protein CHO01_04730 [Cellulomonas hominis]